MLQGKQAPPAAASNAVSVRITACIPTQAAAARPHMQGHLKTDVCHWDLAAKMGRAGSSHTGWQLLVLVHQATDQQLR